MDQTYSPTNKTHVAKPMFGSVGQLGERCGLVGSGQRIGAVWYLHTLAFNGENYLSKFLVCEFLFEAVKNRLDLCGDWTMIKEIFFDCCASPPSKNI